MENRRRAARAYQERNRERHRQRSKEYYHANKERASADSKRRYEERKASYIEHLGGCCVNCGSTENLEFDHITPTDKKEESLATFSHKRAMEVIDKYQLLCHDCHQTKSDVQKLAAWHLFCQLSEAEQSELSAEFQ
jgi:5-methylcytosine-specific restriction endonuclease McrA